MIDRIKQIEWDNRAVLHEARVQGERKGFEKGLEQGLEQGRLKAQISIVSNMLAYGFDIKTIAKCVNLPESKIQEIKASIEKQ